MKALILAGGKGTRLGKLTQNIPKPLIKIQRKPLLEYQIELLYKYGLKDITILINNLGKKIINHFKNGDRWGVNITYYEEDYPLGTAGGIRKLEGTLTGDFLVVYGDLLINIDLDRFIKQHERNKRFRKMCVGTLMVHPNDHPYDSDLVEVREKGIISKFISKPHAENLVYQNLVNAAVCILSPEICRYIPPGRASDFGAEVFPAVVRSGKHFLFAYNTPEYIKDMGTPQRLRQVVNDVKNGKYATAALNLPKPAIFLDRDGVINEEVDQLHLLEDFKLIKNAAEAIREINLQGYYAIVISNQPMISKGLCSYDEVMEIHKKMETDLGKLGAKLDGIYFCPHHPEKGFPGENQRYKIRCRCRKPGTGLLRKAAKDLNIDLKNSYYIGDSTTDALTARKAKINFVGVRTGYACKDGKYDVIFEPGSIKSDIKSAVRYILRRDHLKK